MVCAGCADLQFTLPVSLEPGTRARSEDFSPSAASLTWDGSADTQRLAINLTAPANATRARVAREILHEKITHTQKGPRDASEAVLAGGPLRVHEAATRVRDLEWPS